MRVLVLGGTRFVGHFLVFRLLAGGHQVTLLNRGTTPDPFGDRVARLRCDRERDDLAKALGGGEFDVAVDFTSYNAADGRAVVEALGGGRVGHHVLISTGQVYLVRDGCPRPARETDYDGPLLPEPADAADHAAWAYGIGKRGCEDVLAAAWASDRFPTTVLRIPMVNGERDHQRRLERYLVRMLDGGPLLVPDGGEHRVRHVYGGDVVTAIVKLLLAPSTFGQAYNLAQDETPSLSELLALAAEVLGATPRFVPIPSAELRARGIDPVALSPFSGHWMSMLDPAKAVRELGFRHTPLRRWLETAITSWLAHPPGDHPPGFDPRQRAQEIALAAAMDPGLGAR